MRLGYAIASVENIQRMRPYAMSSINALVKHGGAAALKDTEAAAKIKKMTIDLREKTASDLRAHGYDVIPSQTNFFMVSIGREIQPVIEEFRLKKIQVGRPFPPMTTHMRVSVGTAEEMDRFMKAFKEIFPAKSAVKTTAAVA
jgi:histidinol-phosphate aminotransferase